MLSNVEELWDFMEKEKKGNDFELGISKEVLLIFFVLYFNVGIYYSNGCWAKGWVCLSWAKTHIYTFSVFPEEDLHSFFLIYSNAFHTSQARPHNKRLIHQTNSHQTSINLNAHFFVKMIITKICQICQKISCMIFSCSK